MQKFLQWRGEPGERVKLLGDMPTRLHWEPSSASSPGPLARPARTASPTAFRVVSPVGIRLPQHPSFTVAPHFPPCHEVAVGQTALRVLVPFIELRCVGMMPLATEAGCKAWP